MRKTARRRLKLREISVLQLKDSDWTLSRTQIGKKSTEAPTPLLLINCNCLGRAARTCETRPCSSLAGNLEISTITLSERKGSWQGGRIRTRSSKLTEKIKTKLSSRWKALREKEGSRVRAAPTPTTAS